MQQVATSTIRVSASDVTGQNTKRAAAVPTDTTVGTLLRTFLASMELAKSDAEGRPIQYKARLDREGRHLHSSEMVGDALQEDDHVVLLPDIQAGGQSPDADVAHSCV